MNILTVIIIQIKSSCKIIMMGLEVRKLLLLTTVFAAFIVNTASQGNKDTTADDKFYI